MYQNKHLEAVMVPVLMDNAVSPIHAGIRGDVQDRHLLFIDQELDIHLRISPAGAGKELYGWLIHREPGTNSQSSAVTLFVSGELAEKTTTADFGEFSFPELPVGNIAIEIAVANRRVMACFSV